MKVYKIYYNDGAYYGTMTFNGVSQEEIEEEIQNEIDRNNSHMDKYAYHKMYHISRDNFKEVNSNVN